jgi:hypothetical protein
MGNGKYIGRDVLSGYRGRGRRDAGHGVRQAIRRSLPFIVEFVRFG